MDFQNEPVATTTIADGFRVAILGPIHTNTSWLERELKKTSDVKPKIVELDLAKMPFTSSTGLGVLVSFRNAVVAGGGVLKMVAVQERVLGTIRFAHLHVLLNVDAATKVLKSSDT